MKLNSIFKLYKNYYPCATVQRITFSDNGQLIAVSDKSRSFRLNLLPVETLCDMQHNDNAERGKLMGQFLHENRRELFMLRETRCLYGILYAENLACNLRLMSLVSRNAHLPRTECDGLRLTYLFALTDCVSSLRYSAHTVTVERNGAVYVSVGNVGKACVVKVEPGGKVYAAQGAACTPEKINDEEVRRYSNLFWRDNAEWFANFAAGREDLL